MSNPTIFTIDLNFCNTLRAIGVYLIPHQDGALLVETGPASTLNHLIDGIHQLGFTTSQITDVLLTHIHLDHAGAASWWAQQGTRIHVHHKGAHHLQHPEKLLASAERIYGSQMDHLWGGFLPVPNTHLSVTYDRDMVNIGEFTVKALDVPGHASHHLAYLIGDACFTGDVGGVRVANEQYISLPTPPPDINIDQWRKSIQRLQEQNPSRIIPTHFGVYHDAGWHLQTVLDILDETAKWIEAIMPLNWSNERLREEFYRFEVDRANRAGINIEDLESLQLANPSFMSSDGLARYWSKFKANH